MACMEEKVTCTRFWLESQHGGGVYLEDLNLVETVIQCYINIILKIYYISTNRIRRRGVD